MRLKADSNDTFFHPFEIAFNGSSKSGKTKLISMIISRLCNQYDIGYLKHNTPNFIMDYEGKSTWDMQKSGAKNIFTNDPTHSASLNFQEIDQVEIRRHFIDSDFLLIEESKDSVIPKILVISNENSKDTLQAIQENKVSNILAVVSESSSDPLNGLLPHFHIDNLAAIENFILNHFKELFPNTLNGLVLTGGQSKRMEIDKGGLTYHKEDQITHTKKLLTPLCKQVFISCKESQKDLPFLKNHNLLFDTFPGTGPSTGIMTAQNAHKDSAWLVVGCDLPYLDQETLKNLIEERNPFKVATCYLNPIKNWPEPICTIYEPKSYTKLMQYYSFNKPCPRKVLFNSNIKKLMLKNEMALENVNTPEEKEKAINYLSSHGDNHAN
jgi:molybdopterin-guanine dinucleotide biosynthesis protein MobB